MRQGVSEARSVLTNRSTGNFDSPGLFLGQNDTVIIHAYRRPHCSFFSMRDHISQYLFIADNIIHKKKTKLGTSFPTEQSYSIKLRAWTCIWQFSIKFIEFGKN